MWKNKKKCEHVAEVFKTIAHSDRVAILSFMCSCHQCTCRVKDIYETLNLPQSIVSRHLSLMRKLKIVTRIQKEKEIHYALNLSDKMVSCIRECIT